MFFMRRSALLIALAIAVAGCVTVDTSGSTAPSTTTTLAAATTTTVPATTTTAPAFPVTVEDNRGEVTIDEMPDSIVSLSSTGTEMLFAVGAGEQVVAVDEFSTYPEDAPVTDLSGFEPNVEAILAYEPDLVIISFDPGDLQASLDAVGVPSLLLMTASSLDDSYDQLEVIGTATGHSAEADVVVTDMQDDIEAIVSGTEVPDGTSFYHEVDDTFYSPSSSSYLGQLYALLGMENIADEAEDPGGFGFPQLSSEFIVSSNPDLIFLADVDLGVTIEAVGQRPGWGSMTAVQEGAIVPVDSYLASNWGPRVVEFLEIVADAVTEHTGS
jgi:iron complex transport system substrate-binding protein